jgi:hypothetical protein
MLDLPEIFLSTAELSRVVSRGVRAGKIRRLEGRLCTTNVKDPVESIVRRNLWQIVALLFPGAVVSHRTALEARPTPGGSIFLTGPYARVVRLPGVRIRQIPGPGPLEGDTRFVQTLWLASNARAILDCLRTRRVRGLESPSMPRVEIEDRLDRIVRFSGEQELNTLRDRARAVAPELEADEAMAELDTLGERCWARANRTSAPRRCARGGSATRMIPGAWSCSTRCWPR